MDKFKTVAILCGGKSSRMGFDKSKIIIKGKNIIDYTAEKLSCIFDDILLVGTKCFNTKYRAVEDIIKDCGPAGAIYTSLLTSKSKYVFVVACDMPFLNVDYIKFLKDKLLSCDADCLISKKGQFYEPLCSFYSIDMADIFLKNIKQNNFKIMDIVKESRIIYTQDQEIEMFSNEYDIFANLNYPKDLIILDNFGENINM